MSAAENKRLTQDAFDALANGNGEPFMDSLGEDEPLALLPRRLAEMLEK